MAIDILVATFVILAIMKGVGALLEVGGRWVVCGMAVVCVGLVVVSVVEEGRGWKGLGREGSFVVGGLRGWLV